MEILSLPACEVLVNLLGLHASVGSSVELG